MAVLGTAVRHGDVVQRLGSIAAGVDAMPVDTELGLEVQTGQNVEGEGGVAENLRVVVETLLLLKNHHGVRHTLEAEPV